VVEIRVSVEDATRVPRLVRRLADLFGRPAVSFDRSRHEVRVDCEWESRAVAGLVEAVQTWLYEDGADSATVSIGNSSCTLAAAPPLAVGG
jgi:hypothetical protein